MEKEKRCILVVDDNVDIRYLLKRGLEINGFQVITAENGLDAQDVIANQTAPTKPCLILLDLMMPVMDGWQFLEWKKQNQDVAKLPVVVISAVAPDKTPVDGVVGYLKKPVNFSQMIDYVNSAC